MSKVFCEIVSGDDWDLRLHRNGRFAFRYGFETGPSPEGGTVQSYTTHTSRTAVGALAASLSTFPIAELTFALRAARDADAVYQGEALRLQAEFRAKIIEGQRVARAQLQGRDLEAALSELRELKGGAS